MPSNLVKVALDEIADEFRFHVLDMVRSHACGCVSVCVLEFFFCWGCCDVVRFHLLNHLPCLHCMLGGSDRLR